MKSNIDKLHQSPQSNSLIRKRLESNSFNEEIRNGSLRSASVESPQESSNHPDKLVLNKTAGDDVCENCGHDYATHKNGDNILCYICACSEFKPKGEEEE